ncbi:MAG: histidine kinase, partial [Myxococcales bacterium]|nr:histidine kinase [Myxococcales bacterium]
MTHLEADRSDSPPTVVGLGASAGGLEALEAFFARLPADTGAVFVVVLHLSPDHDSLMPHLLSKHTGMPVTSLEHDMEMLPNNVYVLAPGRVVGVREGRLTVEPQVRTRGQLNLPIDRFLSELARELAERAVAVILSGTGSDGSRGVREVKDRGGVVFVQDPRSAGFDGMPRSAILTGLADHIGDPADLAGRIGNLSTFPPLVAEAATPERRPGVEAVLLRLRSELQVDYKAYRTKMLTRRIERRMAVTGMTTLEAYCDLLDRDATELRNLRQDILIGVTSFFRDPASYRVLAAEALPGVIRAAELHEPFRIWVPACSSGQEAYSLAIQVTETMEAIGWRRPLKVFATDVNELALARASRATYSPADIVDVPPELVAKYFEKRGQELGVRSELRESVIFASHNVISDPPFTRM